MAIVTIQNTLNISVQVGDTLYASLVVNGQSGKNHPAASSSDTKPIAIGEITGVNRSTNQITYNTVGFSGAPSGSVYLFASKDNRVNTSGIIGYFAEVEFRNYSSKSAEIFVTAVDYVPSSK